ncbi:probable aminopeptidase NPEPL1 [Phlebotomus argentipes]|uniref:probable aminopeptidase NPEPL1 n=1 Tax=Phlebotomus argentipes TaxID=94469 RepID=UPI0028937517|nr:probable aminopeptidase NPEPL1 [Phlebotomus argentipes]
MATNIVFNPSLTKTDPHEHPVLIIGQLSHLSLLSFDDLKVKLEPRVTYETFANALACLHPSPTDTCPLYLDLATLAALPLKCSRHNTSSRAHSITKLVSTKVTGVNESVVIVCEKKDLFASACAVVRAFPLYSRKNRRGPIPASTVHVEFIVLEGDKILLEPLSTPEISCIENVTQGIRLAAKIVDTPCNEMNVSHFLEEAQTVAGELNITPLVIRGEDLQTRGFGGIYGVGKAAAVPPALCVLSHKPAGATKTIAWVGKGIVYDTGGLSIKGKTAMPGMKRDCGGAAAILGAFYAAVKGGFTENLHAIFCLAENSVGPNATRPDDIHQLYSGLTVEINNTDAEGRLVLSDGVVYAKKDLSADVILDMATLTGAQGIATGKYHGAILTNNEVWEQKGVDAGRISGDLLSPVPYCPELHFSEFSSSVADMKNSVADRNNAQVSCAGLFVAAHLGFDYAGSWIHIDMASPVHCGERATGYGVALLCSLFGNYTSCSLLQQFAPHVTEPPLKKVCL